MPDSQTTTSKFSRWCRNLINRALAAKQVPAL
jgi:hypothetical protein